MGWYTVRLLLRCEGKGQPKKFHTYEDRFMLVRASSHDDARREAKRLTTTRERPYRNVMGHTVRWKVSHVVEAVELMDRRIDSGTELYSRFIRSVAPMKRLKKELTMHRDR